MSERDEIAAAQIFPFFLYSRELAIRYHIEIRELPLKAFLEGHNPYRLPVDVVCLQTWFDLKRIELERLITCIKSTWPNAGVAYFDWFAPTDLRYAETLDPHILAYVKKQILKDFQGYGTATLGDTNLTDFYGKRFHIDMPTIKFTIPSGFMQKLVLGPNFEYSPLIIRNMLVTKKPSERRIDLHARITTDPAKSVVWYTKMRDEALSKAVALHGRFNVCYGGHVSRRQFYKELSESKLCFSPFGYGEICWRDFEAMSRGSLLFKPDVSHLLLANDYFKPYETYIPLTWDLADLPDKVQYYVHNPSKTRTIVQNAFDVLSQLYSQKKFLMDIAPLWTMVGIG